MYVLIDEWTDRWIDEWTDGWVIDVWINELMING